MSFLSEIEFDNASAETLGHLREIAEWDVDEVAILIKAASKTIVCQWVLKRKNSSIRLKAQQGSCFYSSVRRFIEIALDYGEDEPANLGKELSVMAEEHSQGVWAD